METSNQKLVAAVKMSSKGTNYLNLYINKDGKDYQVDAHRGDFRDFILEDVKWYEIALTGLAEYQSNIGDETFGCGGTDTNVEDIADEISYGFMSDEVMIRDFAEAFDLIDDDLVNVGV